MLCEINLVQLEVVQAELGRMNVENQRLRVMITQVNSNYKSLQVHLVDLMQRQQNQPAQNKVIKYLIIFFNDHRKSNLVN